jgi:DNA-binding MarR family transcriptional regulator
LVYSNLFLKYFEECHVVANWTFLSNHGRALLCITENPTARLRDIASELAITERRAYDIINDLSEAGYVHKVKEGRRNRYEVQRHLPLPEDPERTRPIGEVLQILTRESGE